MPRGVSNELPPDAFGPPPGKTYPCKNCGRQFVQETLKKHEQICKKISSKKRRVFESGKQRAMGSDITIEDVKKAQKEKEKNRGTFKPPKTHWKERHEQFVSAVKSAKHVDYALKTGTPLPPPPQSTVPTDYVKCEYCGRNFNASAAERHVPFCKEQHARKNVSGPSPTDKQKALQARRTQNLAPGGQKPSGPKGGSVRNVGGSAGSRTGPGSHPKNSSIPQPRSSKVPAQTNKGKSPVTGVTNGMRRMNVRK